MRISEDVMDFFSQLNSLHGQMKLNSLLELERLQVSFSPALASFGRTSSHHQVVSVLTTRFIAQYFSPRVVQFIIGKIDEE